MRHEDVRKYIVDNSKEHIKNLKEDNRKKLLELAYEKNKEVVKLLAD